MDPSCTWTNPAKLYNDVIWRKIYESGHEHVSMKAKWLYGKVIKAAGDAQNL